MAKTSSPILSFCKYLLAIVLGSSLYLLFITFFNKSFADYDLWGYLSFGRVFWQEGFFPYKDIFAYTPTKSLWVYHEWLTGTVFFGLIKYLGPASLQLLRYIIAILTIYLIYSTARKRGGSLFYVIIILIPSMLLISFGYVAVRAQIFTFFFFILTLYILECSKMTEDRTILRWLPFIQVVWCNFHGGFVAGLGLIFLFALGEGLMRKNMALSYLKWGVIAALATLINPYGIEYWLYTIHALSMPRPDITEWYSALTALKSHVHVFPVTLFMIMSLITLLVSLVRKKKDVTELLIIATVIFLGIAHIRHNILLGLTFGAYMPVYLSECAYEWNAKGHSFKLIGFLSIVFSTLMIGACFYFYPKTKITFIPDFRIVVSSDYYPTKAIQWMVTNNIKGKILPHFEWGEYLIWSCYPDCRLAMDGRYETVYRDNVHKEYFDFLYGRNGWNVFLRKYPHDIVLLKRGTRTHSLMINEKDWHVVYYDLVSVVFMRKNLKK